jgi:hypothetical protein
MTTINLADLSEAFDFVSAAPPGDHSAYVSLETGAIHWVSDDDAFEMDDVPDDLETSDRCIEVPHRHDLDLGNGVPLRFTDERMPRRYRDVERMFRRRGAYARFKDLLDQEGLLDQWYAYETAVTERALRAWCERVGLQVRSPEASSGPAAADPS